jgi:hypothetical protein
MADEATAKKIIDRISRESAAFGTTIVNENGVGVWRPAPFSSSRQ